MNAMWALVILVVLLALTLGAWCERARHRALRDRYWSRPCTGLVWHRAYREVPPREIRAFLHHFVDAFAFPRRRALSFQPDDCVHEVYATSQTAQTVDMLEYEELDAMLAREYDVVVDLSRPRVTLGQLFEATRR